MSRGRTRSASGRFIRCGLAALLFVGIPTNGWVQAATPAAPVASSSTLSVETDPPGAAVFLDGESLGTTPVAAKTLPAGDHRVRVTKDGYLDNSRVVRLQGGQAESVKVKLTRNEKAAASMQVDPQPTQPQEKKGSGKKWLLIGLGAAAVGTAIVVVAGKNSPPVAGTVGVSPTGTGMAGVTSYSFTAQGASDPDNDPLTVTWNFGDGATGSGATTTHVFASAGAFGVAYTVSDGKGHTVTAPTTNVTVGRSMAGGWAGGAIPVFTGTAPLNLTQNGTSLGGSLTFAGGLTGAPLSVTGTVGGTSYPTAVTITSASFTVGGFAGTFSWRFVGNTDGAGNSMSGTVTLTQTATSVLTFTAAATYTR